MNNYMDSYVGICIYRFVYVELLFHIQINICKIIYTNLYIQKCIEK